MAKINTTNIGATTPYDGITPTRDGLNVNSVDGTVPSTMVISKNVGATPEERFSTTMGAKQSAFSMDLKKSIPGYQQSGTNPLEIQARNQATTQKYLNSAGRILPTLVGDVVEGAGFIAGAIPALFAAALGADDPVSYMDDNFISSAGADMNKYVSDVMFPIYHTQQYQDSTNPFYKMFGEGGEGISSAISFLGSAMVPGMVGAKLGIGAKALKGIGRANKLLKMGKVKEAEALIKAAKAYSKTGKLTATAELAEGISAESIAILKNYAQHIKAIDYMSLHAYNAISEAGFEAHDIKEQAWSKHLWDTDKDGKLINQEAITDLSNSAWGKTFGFNIALLSLTNIPQTSAIFNTFNSAKVSRSALKRAANIKTGKVAKAAYYGRGAAEQIVSEGIIEEGGQLAISNSVLETNGLDVNNIELVPHIFNNMVKNFSTVEGQESMLTGALIGVIGGSGGRYAEKKALQKQATVELFKRDFRDQLINEIGNDMFQTTTRVEKSIDKDGKETEKTITELVRGPLGEPLFKQESLTAAINVLQEGMQYDDYLKESAHELDSKILYNHMMKRHFAGLMSESVKQGLDTQTLNEDINFFVAKQEDIIKAMTPGISQDELTSEVEELKTEYRSTAIDMRNRYKNSSGKAYQMYAKGHILEDQLEGLTNRIYEMDTQSALGLELIRDFGEELGTFEDKHGLTERRESNRLLAEVQYAISDEAQLAEERSELQRDKSPEGIAAFKQTKAEHIKSKERLAAKRKEMKSFEDKEALEVGAKPKVATSKVRTTFRQNDNKRLTKELHKQYVERLQFFTTMKQESKKAIEHSQKLDDVEYLLKAVKEERKEIEKAKENLQNKAKDDHLATFKKNLADVTEVVDLNQFEQIANSKGGEFKIAFDAHVEKLKRKAGVETNGKPEVIVEEPKIETTEPKVEVKNEIIVDEFGLLKEDYDAMDWVNDLSSVEQRDFNNQMDSKMIRVKELLFKNLIKRDVIEDGLGDKIVYSVGKTMQPKTVEKEVIKPSVSILPYNTIKSAVIEFYKTLDLKHVLDENGNVTFMQPERYEGNKQALAAKILTQQLVETNTYHNVFFNAAMLALLTQAKQKKALDVDTIMLSVKAEIDNAMFVVPNSTQLLAAIYNDVANMINHINSKELKEVEAPEVIEPVVEVIDTTPEEVVIPQNTQSEFDELSSIVTFVPGVHNKQDGVVKTKLNAKEGIVVENIINTPINSKVTIRKGLDDFGKPAMVIENEFGQLGYVQTYKYIDEEYTTYKLIDDFVTNKEHLKYLLTSLVDESKEGTINYANYEEALGLSDLDLKVSMKVIDRLLLRSNKTIKGKQVNPLIEFQNWLVKVEQERDTVNVLTEEVLNNNGIVEFQVTSKSQGGFRSDSFNTLDKLFKDKASEQQYGYYKNGRFFNINTELIPQLFNKNKVGKDDGLLYLVTDKTLNKQTTAIPMFPQSLVTEDVNKLYSIIQELATISQTAKNKFHNDRIRELNDQLKSFVYEQHGKQELNKFAASIVNKTGGFELILKDANGIPMHFGFANGKLTLKVPSEQGLTGVDVSDPAAIKSALSNIKYNPDFSTIGIDTSIFNSKRFAIKATPLRNANNDIISFTHGYGIESQNFVFEIGPVEKESTVIKYEEVEEVEFVEPVEAVIEAKEEVAAETEVISIPSFGGLTLSNKGQLLFDNVSDIDQMLNEADVEDTILALEYDLDVAIEEFEVETGLDYFNYLDELLNRPPEEGMKINLVNPLDEVNTSDEISPIEPLTTNEDIKPSAVVKTNITTSNIGYNSTNASIIESYANNRSLNDFNELQKILDVKDLTQEQLKLIDSVLAAVALTPTANNMLNLLRGPNLKGLLDIVANIEGVTNLDVPLDVDTYDLATAMVIMNIASQGKYAQDSDLFISHVVAALTKRAENKSSDSFNISTLADDVYDMIHDVKLHLDTRKEMTDEFNRINVYQNAVRQNEVEGMTNNDSNKQFLTRETLESNAKTILQYLKERAIAFIQKLKQLITGDFKHLFDKKDAEINVMIKPLGLEFGSENLVREFIIKNGGTISESKRVVADANSIGSMYSKHKNKSFFGDAVEYYNGKNVVVMKVKVNKDSLPQLKALLGSTTNFNTEVTSLRNQMVGNAWKQLLNESDVLDNGIHISESVEAGIEENNIWFNDGSKKLNRKWYNIGLRKQNETVVQDIVLTNTLSKKYNLFTPFKAKGTSKTLGKSYASTRPGLTVIYDKITKDNISNVYSDIRKNSKYVTIDYSELNYGRVSIKAELNNGTITTVDIRTKDNIYKSFNDTDAGLALGTQGLLDMINQYGNNTGGYGKLLGMMKDNLSKNPIGTKLVDKAISDYYTLGITPNVKLLASIGGFETKSTINIVKTKEWLNANVPQANLEIIEGLITALDGSLNYGMSTKAAIKLSDKATFGTDFHEALHYAMDNLVAPKYAERVLNQIKITYQTNNTNEAHEILADLYRTYQITKTSHESLPDDVKELLPYMEELLTILETNDKVKELFEDLNKGIYSTSRVNSLQAKDRYSRESKGLYEEKLQDFSYDERSQAVSGLVGMFLDHIHNPLNGVDLATIKNKDRLKGYAYDGVLLYENDIVSEIYKHLATELERADVKHSTSKGFAKESAAKLIVNLNKALKQIQEFHTGEASANNIMNDVMRIVQDTYMYNYVPIHEVFAREKELQDSGFTSESQSVAKLFNDDMIQEDPATTFRANTKQAIARLRGVRNVYDAQGRVSTQDIINPFFQTKSYINFESMLPKIVTSLTGITSEQSLIDKLEEHSTYMPELKQLLSMMKSDKQLSKSMYVDFNKALVDERYVDVTKDATIVQANKSGAYRWVNKWSEDIKTIMLDPAAFSSMIKASEFASIEMFDVMKDKTSNVKTLLHAIVKPLNELGIDINADELYFYATDDINLQNNIITGKPILNYEGSIRDKILASVAPLVNEVNNALSASAKAIKAVKPGDSIVFDLYGYFNNIAKIKDRYSKEGFKLTYLDLKNDSKSSISKITLANKFLNIMRSGDMDLIAQTLNAYNDDPSMKFSNFLHSSYDTAGNIVRHGLLMQDEYGNSVLPNPIGLKDFNMFIHGGISNRKSGVKQAYKAQIEENWYYSKLANYLLKQSNTRPNVVAMTAITPGDASNNYFYTFQKFVLNTEDAKISDTSLNLRRNSIAATALLKLVAQEQTRMNAARKLLFDIDEYGNLKLKEYSDEFYNNAPLVKNYHYTVDRNGNRVFLDSNGRPTGNVFNYHNFTSLNDEIGKDPNTGWAHVTKEGEDNIFVKNGFKDQTEWILSRIGSELRQELANAKAKYTDILTSENSLLPKGHDVDIKLLEYIINQRVFNVEIQNMFSGTTSEFPNTPKGRSQVIVRSKSLHQGGHEGMNTNDPYVRVGVIRDIEIDSTTIDEQMEIVDAQLKREGYVKGSVSYESKRALIEGSMRRVNRGDGQGYMTLHRWVAIQKSQGRWNEYKYMFNEAGVNKLGDMQYTIKEGLAFKDYKKLVEVVKPVYSHRASHAIDSNNSVMINQYVKYASFPLLEQFTKYNPQLDKIRRYMEEVQEDGRERFHEIIFESAEKQGATNIANVTDELGNILETEDGSNILDTIKPKELLFEKYRIQLELTEHSMDEENKLGIQITKSIIGNIMKDFTYTVGDRTYNGSEIIAEHFNTLNDLIESDFYNLLAKLHLTVNEETGELDIDDVNIIKDIFLEELSRTGITDDDLKLFEIEDGKFKNSLDVNIIRTKLVSIFNAQFTNHVKNTKFTGGHLTLVSDAFINGSVMNPEQYIAHLKSLGIEHSGEATGLKTRVINGMIIADVIMPAMSKDFYNADGTLIPIDQIHPDILRVMGYRIPNTGKHSNVVFNIVGFTPREAGSIIITPFDFVGRTGWDFDVDSVYMMNRNHKRNPKFGQEGEYKYVSANTPTSYEMYMHEQLDAHIDSLKGTNLHDEYLNSKGAIKSFSKENPKHLQLQRLIFKDIKRGADPTEAQWKAIHNHKNFNEFEVLRKQFVTLNDKFRNNKNAAKAALIEKHIAVSKDVWESDVTKRDTKKSLQNNLFNIWESIQLSNNHVIEALSPSSFDTNKGVRDEILNEITSSDDVTGNPSSVTYQDNIFSKAVMDKHNLAIFASYGSLLNLHQVTNSKLSRVVTMDFTQEELGLERTPKGNLTKIGKEKFKQLSNDYTIEYANMDKLPVLGDIINITFGAVGRSKNGKLDNVLGQSISQMIGEDTDNAADAIKDNLIPGLNATTMGVYSAIKAIGGTTRYAGMLINQPAIRYFNKSKASSERADKTDIAIIDMKMLQGRILLANYNNDPSAISKYIDSLSEQARESLSISVDSLYSHIERFTKKLSYNKKLDPNTMFDNLPNAAKGLLESVYIKNVSITSDSLKSQLHLDMQTLLDTNSIGALNYQYSAMSKFKELRGAASEITGSNSLLNLDKQEVGSSFNNTHNKYNTIFKTLEDYVYSVLFEEDYYMGLKSENTPLIGRVYPTIYKAALTKVRQEFEEAVRLNAFNKLHEVIKNLDVTKRFTADDLDEVVTLIRNSDSAMSDMLMLGIDINILDYKDLIQYDKALDKLETDANKPSIYPIIEKKFILANMGAYNVISKLMMSENPIFRKYTSGKLFDQFGAFNADVIERYQSKLTDFTLASLAGEDIHDLTNRVFQGKTTQSVIVDTWKLIQKVLNETPSIKEDGFHILNNIDILTRQDHFNNDMYILKYSGGKDLVSLNSVKASIDEMYDTSLEGSDIETIMDNLLAIGFKRNGFGFDSYGLSIIATQHIRTKLGMFEGHEKFMKELNDNPESATLRINDIYNDFILKNTSDNFFAPVVKKSFLKDNKLTIENGVIKVNSFLGETTSALKGSYFKIFNSEFNPEQPKLERSYTLFKRGVTQSVIGNGGKTSTYTMFNKVDNTIVENNSLFYSQPLQTTDEYQTSLSTGETQNLVDNVNNVNLIDCLG